MPVTYGNVYIIGHRMSFVSDGIAKKVADTAVDLASKTDETEEMKKNHLY